VNIPEGESLVTVNLSVPKGDNHTIAIASELVELRRTPSGNGVSYPFNSPSNVVSIIDNTFNALDFYYFFYDWNFTSKGGRCESIRTPINVNIAADSPDLSDGDTTYSISGGAPVSFSNGDTIEVDSDVTLELTIPASQFNASVVWTAPGGQTYTTDSISFANIPVDGDENGNWTVEVTYGSNCGTASQIIDFTVNSEVTLGIEENDLNTVKVHPNPADNILYITNIVDFVNPVITVFDIQGRRLNNIFNAENVTAKQIELNVSSLTKGAYFISIENGQKKLIKKIIKQ